MIKKCIVAVLGCLCWTSSTFAMLTHLEDEKAKTRQSFAPPKDLLHSLRHNQLIVWVQNENFDAAQSYCQQKAFSTTGVVSQLFRQAERALASSQSIQKELPDILRELGPYLEADSLTSSCAQPKQETPPAENSLTKHPLIIALKSRDYDAAQSYCQQKAHSTTGGLSQLFRQAERVFSGSETGILAALPELLRGLAAHLQAESGQSGPTSSVSLPLSYEEMAQRMKEEVDAHMGTEFTLDFATEIDANYRRVVSDAASG